MLRVFKMSAVISSTIIRLCNRAPDAFRGEALRQHTMVPHLNTNTHTYTHSRFVQHWNNMRQRLMRWGYIRTATVLQFSTNAELMGGGRREKKTLCITVLGGRLWRLTRHSKPASPHALGRAPAMLLGSICCSSQLQVAEGASLQEDLTTRHLSLQNTGADMLKMWVNMSVFKGSNYCQDTGFQREHLQHAGLPRMCQRFFLFHLFIYILIIFHHIKKNKTSW